MSALERFERALRELREALPDLVRDEVKRALAGANAHDEYVTTGEAAQLVRVAPDTIRRWIRDGRLEAFNAGRERRVRRADLEYLMRAGQRRAPSEDLTDREIDAMVERDFG